MQNYPVGKASSRAERRIERRNQKSIIRTLNHCRVLIRLWQKASKLSRLQKVKVIFVELQRNLLR